MPTISPIVTSAFPAACDFVSSQVAFNRALDGGIPPRPASTPLIQKDGDEFIGGGPSQVALAKERDVDLPLEKWEGHKRYFNTVHISLLVLMGAATWPVSIGSLALFGVMLIVPPRLGTLPLLALEPSLDSLDKNLCGLRNEFRALISDFTDAAIAQTHSGEITRLHRKKMRRTTRDAEDKIRKKWREMDQPLRDMRMLLGKLSVPTYYFRSWIPRISEAVPNAVVSFAFSKLPLPVWRNYTTIEKIFDLYRTKYEDHLKAWRWVAAVLQLGKMAVKEE